jgi:fructan beta-fructosidase
MQYFVGDFDGTDFTADDLSYPLYLDHGKDFYAGIIFNSLPEKDKRKIMIGWNNCWQYANEIPTKGFRGQMSVPRELGLATGENGEYRVRSYPAKEVNKYRGQLLFSKPVISVSGNKLLPGVKSNALDIEFVIQRGDASKAGIRLFKHGDHETVVYYDKSDNSIKIDRTKSGKTDFSDKFASVESVKLADDKSDIPVRILTDKNVVEVYVNNGMQVMTDLVFPLSETVTTELFSEGGTTTFKNVRIWKMNPSMK